MDRREARVAVMTMQNIWLTPNCNGGNCWMARTWCPDDQGPCCECGLPCDKYVLESQYSDLLTAAKTARDIIQRLFEEGVSFQRSDSTTFATLVAIIAETESAL